MSLLKTKPRWCPLAVPSDRGWINSNTGELLVAVRGLKSYLEAEQKEAEMIKKEIENKKQEQKPVLTEQTIKKPRKNQKIIAEVVEYKIGENQEVIGE